MTPSRSRCRRRRRRSPGAPGAPSRGCRPSGTNLRGRGRAIGEAAKLSGPRGPGITLVGARVGEGTLTGRGRDGVGLAGRARRRRFAGGGGAGRRRRHGERAGRGGAGGLDGAMRAGEIWAVGSGIKGWIFKLRSRGLVFGEGEEGDGAVVLSETRRGVAVLGEICWCACAWGCLPAWRGARDRVS